MDESEYKKELRRIKVKKKQLSTKLETFLEDNDVSLIENTLKLMSDVAFEVTDMIDELTITVDEFDGDNEEQITELEEMKSNVKKTLNDAKQKLKANKIKNVDVSMPAKKEDITCEEENDTGGRPTLDQAVLDCVDSNDKKSILTDEKHKLKANEIQNVDSATTEKKEDNKAEIQTVHEEALDLEDSNYKKSALNDGKEKLKANKIKHENVTTPVEKEDYDKVEMPTLDQKSLRLEDSNNKKSRATIIGQNITKKTVTKAIVKEEAASYIGEGIHEMLTDNPAEVVLELVLGTITQQLGPKGTSGFLTAAMTHYAISQFAVLIGVVTTPIKMDFSGITQAKILKKLEDLNTKVDMIMKAPIKKALSFLTELLIELDQHPAQIDFQAVKDKLMKVIEWTTEALAMDSDFTNMAVCTKYLLFAETLTQSFTEERNEQGTFLGYSFRPAEKLSETKKSKIAGNISRKIEELKKKAETKGKKKDEHQDKIDDILKWVYSIISVCNNLSNPYNLISNEITFGVDKKFVPYEEEDAAPVQVGSIQIPMEEEEEEEEDAAPVTKFPKILGYLVYLWRSETLIHVRRELKVFNIPLRQIHGDLIWVKLTEEKGVLSCQYDDNKEIFRNTATVDTGFPDNILTMDDLFETVKDAKDMSSLPKSTFEKMQRYSDVYLSDLGVNIDDYHDEPEEKKRTLLHYVCLLTPTRKFKTAIDCLVDAGADLGCQDSEGKTPLMLLLSEKPGLKENIKTLINHYRHNPAIKKVDKAGNNVLHIVAGIQDSKAKEYVTLLLSAEADATHENKKGFKPADLARYNGNTGVYKILHEYLNTTSSVTNTLLPGSLVNYFQRK